MTNVCILERNRTLAEFGSYCALACGVGINEPKQYGFSTYKSLLDYILDTYWGSDTCGCSNTELHRRLCVATGSLADTVSRIRSIYFNVFRVLEALEEASDCVKQEVMLECRLRDYGMDAYHLLSRLRGSACGRGRDYSLVELLGGISDDELLRLLERRYRRGY